MATASERQRKRRSRLREAGFSDVTVTVRETDKAQLRRFVRALNEGQVPGLFAGTRLPRIIQALRNAREVLHSSGVLHAGVFGSTARGEDGPDSDVDIAIDVDPEVVSDVIEMVRAVEAVGAALPAGVTADVVDRRTLKSRIRERADREMVRAF